MHYIFKIINKTKNKMRYEISLRDYAISVIFGLVITMFLAPILILNTSIATHSIEWWVFQALFFGIASYTTYICYRAVFIPPAKAPTVPKRILSFDEAIRKSEYNFCAISSKELALWKSPTFLYYLILNDIKNIIEYNLKNKASIVKFSTEAIDKKNFYNEGISLIGKIAGENIRPEFQGVRLLIYPENIFNDYADEIQALIQMHATARVHCIPVIREILVNKLTTEERNTLNDFSKEMGQNIPDEYTALSRFDRVYMYFKKKKQEHPYSVSIPDFLIINYNPFDRSEEGIWWYVQEKANHNNKDPFVSKAENCYKIICEKINKTVLWEQYTSEIFGMIPVGELEKFMQVDFFSQDYFKKWLAVIQHKPEFTKLKQWFEKEDNILEELINKNNEITEVLDVGCGWGRHIEIILKNKKIKKVAGVDKSSLMVEKAMRLYNTYGDERIIIKLEDGKKMSFGNDKFDLVICMTNTFGNLGPEDIKKRVLDEMIRVLRPGGMIILSCYKDSTTALEIRKKSYLAVDLHPFIGEDNKTISTKEGLISEQFKEEEVLRWLESNKLKSIEIIPINDLAFIVTGLKDKNNIKSK